MIIRLSVCLLAFAAGVVKADPLQSYDSYKSWLVACDNTLTCVAKGFGDNEVRAEITVTRAAGADGELSLSMASGAAFTIDQVKVDGNAVTLKDADWKSDASDVGSTFSSSQLSVVRSLMARIKDGSKLSLGSDGEIPLDGLSAGLLRMDERQGRLGGTTALVRNGRLPATHVPNAPSAPIIPDRPLNALLNPNEAEQLASTVRSTQAPLLMEEGCQDDRLAIEPEVYALSDARALVTFACIMRAYQGSSIGFLVSRTDGAVERLKLPVPYQTNEAERASGDLLTEHYFDPATGRLSVSARGRGLADCGMSAEWLWNGNEFTLSDLALQQSCGGTEPGDWPTLFRSKS